MGILVAEQCIQYSIWPLCSRTVVNSLVKGLLVEQKEIYSLVVGMWLAGQ